MEYNWKKISFALIVLIVGVTLALTDNYFIQSERSVWLSIGCSLIASAMFALLNVLIVDAKIDTRFTKWGLNRIYNTRAEKNKDSDPKLSKIKYQLDGVAFGLKTFRAGHSDEIENALKRGVNIRLLTMNPNSDFVAQREIEENESAGQIKNTIEQLIQWAQNLNAKGYKGKICIKGYNCMTLDFYWRMDGEIYIGPYWLGRPSQQTVTYRLAEGGKGFETYAKYFEELWNNEKVMVNLVTA